MTQPPDQARGRFDRGSRPAEIVVTPGYVELDERTNRGCTLHIIPPADNRNGIRVRSTVRWLRISREELSERGGDVELEFDADAVGSNEAVSGQLTATLTVEIKPGRVGAPPPRVSVPVVVQLQTAWEALVETQPPALAGVLDPEEVVSADSLPAPTTELPVLVPSIGSLQVSDVPIDGRAKRTIRITSRGRIHQRVDVLSDAEWLVVTPSSLDFGSGSLGQDIHVEISGRMLPAVGESRGTIWFTPAAADVMIPILATCEGREAGEARAQVLKSYATRGAILLFGLYILILLLPMHMPLVAVAPSLLAALALAVGIVTWRNTGTWHAFVLGLLIAVGSLVLGDVLDRLFLPHSLVILIPALAVYGVWGVSGIVFRATPSAVYLVPVVLVSAGIVAAGILVGVLKLDLGAPPAGLIRQGSETVGSVQLAPAQRPAPLPPSPAEQARPPQESRAAGMSGNTTQSTTRVGEPVNDVPQSAGALKKYLRTHPDNVVALNRLAELLRGEGKTREALELFRRSLAVNPTQVNIQKQVRDLDADHR